MNHTLKPMGKINDGGLAILVTPSARSGWGRTSLIPSLDILTLYDSDGVQLKRLQQQISQSRMVSREG